MVKKNNKLVDPIFENAAKVVVNKAVHISEKPCVRALGSEANLVRASMLGLQNSDLLGLITAHLVLKYCLESKGKSPDQLQEYKDGVTGFIKFLTDCSQELAVLNDRKQQKEVKKA